MALEFSIIPKIIIAIPFLRYYFNGPKANAKRNLDKLNIVITGSTSGIGLITTKILLNSNASVYAICRDVSKMDKIAQKWEKEGIKID